MEKEKLETCLENFVSISNFKPTGDDPWFVLRSPGNYQEVKLNGFFDGELRKIGDRARHGFCENVVGKTEVLLALPRG